MADLLNAGVQLPGDDVVLRAIAINGSDRIEKPATVDGVGRVLCMDLGSGDPSLPFIAGSLKAMVLNDDQPIAAGLGRSVAPLTPMVVRRFAAGRSARVQSRLDRGSTNGLLEIASQRWTARGDGGHIQGRSKMNHDIDTVRAPFSRKDPATRPRSSASTP